MAKTIPANIQSYIDTNTGTNPFIIVKIAWGSSTVYYGDKATTIGATSIDGRILTVSDISNLKKAESSGEISTCSIGLSDYDGALKTLLNTVIPEGKAVTIV
jgi:hypothetical protein